MDTIKTAASIATTAIDPTGTLNALSATALQLSQNPELWVLVATWVYQKLTERKPLTNYYNDPYYQDKANYDKLCLLREDITGKSDTIPDEWRLDTNNCPQYQSSFSENSIKIKKQIESLNATDYPQKTIVIGLLLKIERLFASLSQRSNLLYGLSQWKIYRQDGIEAMFFSDLAMWVSVDLPRYNVKKPETAVLITKWVDYCEKVHKILIFRNDVPKHYDPKYRLQSIIKGLKRLRDNVIKTSEATTFNDKICAIESLFRDKIRHVINILYLVLKNSSHPEILIDSFLDHHNQKSGFVSDPEVTKLVSSLMGKWIIATLQKTGIKENDFICEEKINLALIHHHLVTDYQKITDLSKTGLWPFAQQNKELSISYLADIIKIHRMLLVTCFVQEQIISGAKVNAILEHAWVYGKDTEADVINDLTNQIELVSAKMCYTVTTFWNRFYTNDFRRQTAIKFDLTEPCNVQLDRADSEVGSLVKTNEDVNRYIKEIRLEANNSENNTAEAKKRVIKLRNNLKDLKLIMNMDEHGCYIHFSSIQNAKRLNLTNCYVWDGKKLVYLRSLEIIEQAPITNSVFFSKEINKLKSTNKDSYLLLSAEQVNMLITSNGGHSPVCGITLNRSLKKTPHYFLSESTPAVYDDFSSDRAPTSTALTKTSESKKIRVLPKGTMKFCQQLAPSFFSKTPRQVTSIIDHIENPLNQKGVATHDTRLSIGAKEQSILPARSNHIIELPGRVRRVEADGNCFYRAVSVELERQLITRLSHVQLRKIAVDYLRNNPSIFDDFPPENETNEAYLDNMSKDGVNGIQCWAHGPIIPALAKALSIELKIIDLRLSSNGKHTLSEITINKGGSQALVGLLLNSQHYDALELDNHPNELSREPQGERTGSLSNRIVVESVKETRHTTLITLKNSIESLTLFEITRKLLQNKTIDDLSLRLLLDDYTLLSIHESQFLSNTQKYIYNNFLVPYQKVVQNDWHGFSIFRWISWSKIGSLADLYQRVKSVMTVIYCAETGLHLHCINQARASELKLTDCFIWDQEALTYISPDGQTTPVPLLQKNVFQEKLKKLTAGKTSDFIYLSAEDARDLITKNGGYKFKTSRIKPSKMETTLIDMLLHKTIKESFETHQFYTYSSQWDDLSFEVTKDETSLSITIDTLNFSIVREELYSALKESMGCFDKQERELEEVRKERDELQSSLKAKESTIKTQANTIKTQAGEIKTQAGEIKTKEGVIKTQADEITGTNNTINDNLAKITQLKSEVDQLRELIDGFSQRSGPRV